MDRLPGDVRGLVGVEPNHELRCITRGCLRSRRRRGLSRRGRAGSGADLSGEAETEQAAVMLSVTRRANGPNFFAYPTHALTTLALAEFPRSWRRLIGPPGTGFAPWLRR